ncbi:hypothetical protein ACJX0J_020370, partial [Zea mays]
MLVLISTDWKRDRDYVVQFTKSVYMYIQHIFAFKYIHELRFSGLEIGFFKISPNNALLFGKSGPQCSFYAILFLTTKNLFWNIVFFSVSKNLPLIHISFESYIDHLTIVQSPHVTLHLVRMLVEELYIVKIDQY